MKAISRLIAVFLMIASATGTTAHATDQSHFADVPANAMYAEAVNALYEVGVFTGYEDGTFGPSRMLTRAEFATMICRLLGFTNRLVALEPASSGFSDVQPNHWSSGFVATAVEAGLVNGFPNGTFRPNDSLTFEQTIAVLVRAYGRDIDELASSSGGWPDGYIDVAGRIGITDGIEISVGKPISRSEVAMLMYNTIEISQRELADGAWEVNTVAPNPRWIRSVDYNADGSIAQIWEFAYSHNGNRINEAVYWPNGVLYMYWDLEYNADNQNVRTTVYIGDGSVMYWSVYVYDPNGNLVDTITYNEDGTISETTSIDPRG